MRQPALRPAILLVLLTAACATKPVDLKEPRRAVGTESGVRVDASVYAESMSTTSTVAIKYDVTNNRQTTVAIADLVPETTYDPETQTVTVTVGSEVPGNTLLPRLIAIPPGEKKSFQIAAHINIVTTQQPTPMSRFPNMLRLKVNFLGDVRPFVELVGISERAVANPTLADALFPKWVELTESITTSGLPMHWVIEPDVRRR